MSDAIQNIFRGHFVERTASYIVLNALFREVIYDENKQVAFFIFGFWYQINFSFVLPSVHFVFFVLSLFFLFTEKFSLPCQGRFRALILEEDKGVKQTLQSKGFLVIRNTQSLTRSRHIPVTWDI